MKKLFGQKPKVPKPPQPNPIPTPVPADQFRPHPRGPSDERWIIVQDDIPQERSRKASFTSFIPGATSLPSPPTPNDPSAHDPIQAEHYGSPDKSSNSLLHSNHNHILKKKPPTGVHGTTAILRSLDPEQPSLTRSVSPSLESLPLTVETERDPRAAEREYEAERERVRQREKERERERRKDHERQRDRGRDRDQDHDKGKDRDKPKEKERKKGLFSSSRDKEKEREREAELTRMIGYLTATASEDWSLVLEVCERASSNEGAARDASRALRREFKYAEPGAQLSAARLWAIMLRNCSEVFITQASSKKFIDTLEEVLLSGSTSPVVRERLLDVLAAAAFAYPGHGKDGYRALWKKVKPPNKPEEGVPFDEDDAMLNPSPLPEQRNRHQSQPMNQQRVISADEDIRRLFEECEIGRGNAQLLNQALTFARPEELVGPLISEWYRKCRNSQDFIMAQIPWATAQADRSRAEIRILYLDENGQETRPIPTTKEEELLASLLGANQELLEAFRIYDDLERLGVAEMEEREIAERSRKEFKLDRTQIQFIAEDGSFRMDDAGGTVPGPSRSPSPSPAPSFANLPPMPAPRPGLPSPPTQLTNHQSHSPSPHSGLAPPPPAPHGPRQARPSRTPSPDQPAVPPALVPQHGHSGSLGVDIKRLARMSFESTHDVTDLGSEVGSVHTPVVPSAKAMGKRKVVVEGSGDSDDPSNSDEFADGQISPFLGDDPIDNEDENSNDGPAQRWKKKPMKFAYDAAAERSKEMRRDLGIPVHLTNGKAR